MAEEREYPHFPLRYPPESVIDAMAGAAWAGAKGKMGELIAILGSGVSRAEHPLEERQLRADGAKCHYEHLQQLWDEFVKEVEDNALHEPS